MKDFIHKISGFFPTQLITLQFKSNYLSLVFWVLLFGIVSKKILLGFGVPYLFLSPEYLGEVSFWSYAIVGFAIGGYIMAFNTYSYVMLGRSFPFLATLKRPFLKFSINNSLIPLVFVIMFIINIILYTLDEDLGEWIDALFNVLGFASGLIMFLVISAYYFFKTNKNLDLIKKRKERTLITSWIPGFKRTNERAYFPKTYIHSVSKIQLCRDVAHYSQSQLNRVYSQNHINAVLFEVMIIVSFLIIGLFQGYKYFLIPAGASIVLLFTLSQMLVSALYNWFRSWAMLVIIFIFVLLNTLSSKFEILQFHSQAIGLDYEAEKANYKTLSLMNKDVARKVSDLHNQISILEKWKAKTGQDKPKLIIVNSSGGGIRSAYWNFMILQKLDFETEGKFFDQTQMITGASGGMIGSAYYRELFFNKNPLMGDAKYLDTVSADLLNQCAASLVTNDLFLKFRKGDYNGKDYIKDRGFAFEENLIQNFGEGFNKPLSYLSNYEKEAVIPQMIFAPTIIEDGRRMLISTQPMAFLSKTDQYGVSENIEYIKLLKNNGAMDTRMASVLRMNATFPYVLPMVSLPTVPASTIMDAGLRDNYGGNITIEYILGLRKWIEANTSGVVIVQMRDIGTKGLRVEDKENSMVQRIIKPLGNVYDNLFSTQDYYREGMFRMVSNEVNFPMDVISFDLMEEEGEMSLSWRLTEAEKRNVIRAWNKATNQSEFRRLVRLIQD
jgi:hypothetical protein